MVGCGLACVGGGDAGVSGCEFRGSGWGWDRRCQDPGARGLGPGGGGGSWGTIPYGGGGVATRHTGPYIYIYTWMCVYIYVYDIALIFIVVGYVLQTWQTLRRHGLGGQTRQGMCLE